MILEVNALMSSYIVAIMELSTISDVRDAELAEFETEIAHRWAIRGNETRDPYSKFLFYFIGFNALYFLWGRIKDLPAKDGLRFRDLVGSVTSNEASTIMLECKESVRFFSDRPITDMRARPRSASQGLTVVGERNRRTLANKSNTSEVRLKALSNIIYQVRNNLAHGSKGDFGDDRQVVTAAIEPTRRLLELAIKETERTTSS